MKTLDQLRAIKTHEEIAAFFGFKEYKALARIVFGTPDSTKYRSFSIPKRSGGKRIIESPNRQITSLQRILLPILTEAYKPHPCAFAYVKSRNSLQNARRHAGAKFVFNIDLQDYFHSIHFGRIRGLFCKIPFNLPPNIASILANICCYKGHLPQGAPTSPILANLITAKLDKQLFSLAKNHNCIYTRYADDITFSFTSKKTISSGLVVLGPETVKVGSQMSEIITGNGFKINENKVRFSKQSNRIEVTGIILNEIPNVNRVFIRQISSILYSWQKYGLEKAEKEHLTKYRKKHRASKITPKLFRIVHGKLSYLRLVRGSSDSIYVKLAKWYNSLRTVKMPKLRYEESETTNSLLAKSVVVIEIENVSQGTGFFLKDIGLITCYHVVKGAGQLPINIYYPGSQKRTATVRHYCEHRDIAILDYSEDEVLPKNQLLPDDSTHGIGSEIIIAGYPSHAPGKSISICSSRITAHATVSAVKGFEVDINIRKGNSGGPVVTNKRHVIGVITDGAFGNEGHNRAVNISEVYKLHEELKVTEEPISA